MLRRRVVKFLRAVLLRRGVVFTLLYYNAVVMLRCCVIEPFTAALEYYVLIKLNLELVRQYASTNARGR